jgi:hypothetical protein
VRVDAFDANETIKVGVAGPVTDPRAALAELLEDVDVQQTPADHGYPR